MKVLILMGSPRLHGNTAELCKPFREELEANGAAVRYVTLADRVIHPCKGCYACQEISGEYGCCQKDEMPVADILWADLIVLATPIYAWYCAAPMKNVLDRHYGFNKYYGSAEGSLWAGKRWPFWLPTVTRGLTLRNPLKWGCNGFASTPIWNMWGCIRCRIRIIWPPSRRSRPWRGQGLLPESSWLSRIRDDMPQKRIRVRKFFPLRALQSNGVRLMRYSLTPLVSDKA